MTQCGATSHDFPIALFTISSISGIYTVFEKGDRAVVYNQSPLEGDLLVPVTKARES